MAHIPVQPAKRGVPWWLWLVLALAVAAILAFFLLANDDDDVVMTDADTTQVVIDEPAVGPMIVDADSIPDVAGIDAASYAGRRVELDDARVSRVVGDSAFYVQTAAGREVLVVLDEPAGVSTAGAADGFTVTRNERARVRGTLRQAPEGFRGIPRAARTGMRDGALYVAASAADVTAMAEAMPEELPVPMPMPPATPRADTAGTMTPPPATPTDSTTTR